jgi:hypothetical protein
MAISVAVRIGTNCYEACQQFPANLDQGIGLGGGRDFHRFAFRGLPPFLPLRLAAAALAFDLTEPPLLPMAVSQARASFGNFIMQIYT